MAHGQDYPEALRSPQKASQGLSDALTAALPRQCEDHSHPHMPPGSV